MWTGEEMNAIRWTGTLRAKKFEGDGSLLTGLPGGAFSDLTASGANITIYNGANAVNGTGTQISISSTGAETDPIFNAASAALFASLALVDPHIADSTDPHGQLLTQTYISLTSGALTADLTASGAALIRNILIGTEASGALTASNYTQGTIYLKYT